MHRWRKKLPEDLHLFYRMLHLVTGAQALRTLPRTATVEALPPIACTLAGGAIAGPVTNIALHFCFIHVNP